MRSEREDVVHAGDNCPRCSARMLRKSAGGGTNTLAFDACIRCGFAIGTGAELDKARPDIAGLWKRILMHCRALSVSHLQKMYGVILRAGSAYTDEMFHEEEYDFYGEEELRRRTLRPWGHEDAVSVLREIQEAGGLRVVVSHETWGACLLGDIGSDWNQDIYRGTICTPDEAEEIAIRIRSMRTKTFDGVFDSVDVGKATRLGGRQSRAVAGMQNLRYDFSKGVVGMVLDAIIGEREAMPYVRAFLIAGAGRSFNSLM